MAADTQCRLCKGVVVEFFDFGLHPLSDVFLEVDSDPAQEFFYRLAVGLCGECTMVQLIEEVPRERMFHEEYSYHSSGSAFMRTHFESFAKQLLTSELNGSDPFLVELGCNDGVMLKALADAGVRHLGVEPSGNVADIAASRGVRVRKSFFELSVAEEIREEDGPADVIYAANTLCHIPYMESILSGVVRLLKPSGVFVFEDPYLGAIIERTSFDQIYDEHFYFFTVRSVQAMALRAGLEVVDAQELSVHGGEVRYWLAPQGARQPTKAVAALRAKEDKARLAEMDTMHGFGSRVVKVRDDLLTLLRQLRTDGKRVVAYGATAKSSTVTNLCGIDTELIEAIFDSTPTKQGRLAPGSHIPVVDAERFSDPYPDYAVLFAWNHADEIMAKEARFRESGGQWILYVPDVRAV